MNYINRVFDDETEDRIYAKGVKMLEEYRRRVSLTEKQEFDYLMGVIHGLRVGLVSSIANAGYAAKPYCWLLQKKRSCSSLPGGRWSTLAWSLVRSKINKRLRKISPGERCNYRVLPLYRKGDSAV